MCNYAVNRVSLHVTNRSAMSIISRSTTGFPAAVFEKGDGGGGAKRFEIVANCVSQWLLHSLCMNNVKCFPSGKHIGTRFLMHNTVNALQNFNLNFAKQFISYLPKSPWVQMLLVSVIRNVMLLYVDLDVVLNHQTRTHIGCVLEQMQACKNICKFQSLFCISTDHVFQKLHSASYAEILH